jgi:hypothetical protein
MEAVIIIISLGLGAWAFAKAFRVTNRTIDTLAWSQSENGKKARAQMRAENSDRWVP